MTTPSNSNNMNGHALALIIRFLPNLDEPRLPDDFVSKYDPVKNILRIDRERFEALSPEQQSYVLRTRSNVSVKKAEKTDTDPSPAAV